LRLQLIVVPKIDEAAVRALATLPWSNRQAEDQITRMKFIV